MLLNEIARVSAQVAQVPGRRAKIDLIAELLGRAEPDEVPLTVAFLSGELRQRQIGVGYAALSDLVGLPGEPGDSAAGRAGAPAAQPALTVIEADRVFAAIGAVTGAGSQKERRRQLAGLFAQATTGERSFLIQLVAGELRQGALEGVMTEAVAQAAAVPAQEFRRALMLGGSLPAVAQAALAGTPDPLGGPGEQGGPDELSGEPAGGERGPEAALSALRSFRLRTGRPLRPMLAASAPTVEAALAKVTPAALEWKIDGIRVQVHKDGERVSVFTRTLDDITSRVPEIVAAALALPAAGAVLDGEAIALHPSGRPRPFQITASRTGSREGVEQLRADLPLTTFFFDLLHLDGTDLIDAPAQRRQAELARLLPASLVVPRTVTSDLADAEAFFADAVSRGHEGVVVKSLDAPYGAGRRGGEWIKVKPRHTLDLVVLAAEWGHGRRQGWLSNLHLGARDPASGDLIMLGKTFKGLTDKLLDWQTGRLLELAVPGQRPVPADRTQARGVLRVRPELVVEIAFDGVQVSRRYPGGLALRFARVLRYRPDKRTADADTIDTVRALGAEPEELDSTAG